MVGGMRLGMNETAHCRSLCGLVTGTWGWDAGNNHWDVILGAGDDDRWDMILGVMTRWGTISNVRVSPALRGEVALGHAI